MPRTRTLGSARRAIFALSAFGFVVVLPRVARADVSSWLFLGPGVSSTQEGKADPKRQPTLVLDTGIGTPPSGIIAVGALFHFQPHFGRGSDLGLMMRTATRGFVNGGWGAAIDLGGYQRWWGIGSSGGMGQLALGAPWGITLEVGGGIGTNDSRHMSAVIGIDLARLTVYRRTGESWWLNPFPAYRPEEEER
jgi:hypothetical protein